MRTHLFKYAVGRTLAIAAIGMIASCGDDPQTQPNASESSSLSVTHSPKPSILLVHGAWADALGWREVIALLQAGGYPVVAVENPLTSLALDVATTKRAIDALALKGPLVVVGHSYGGAVITGAAAGNPQVKALVYINAFAPDTGEPVGALVASVPPTALADAIVPDAAGFLFIDPAQFRAAFCADVSAPEANVLAVAQKPLIASAFGETLDSAAWKTVPSWYLVGKQDQAISPDLQRFMARRMGAHVVEIDSSHASFVSHPRAVVRLIEQAAGSIH